MAPSTSTQTGVLFEDDPVEQLEASLHNDHEHISPPKPAKEYRRRLVWRNIILFAFLHTAALYGAYLVLSFQAKILTVIWGEYCGCVRTNFVLAGVRAVIIVFSNFVLLAAFLLYEATGLGITAGAHRLWAHRAYKANWPLRLILVIFNTIAFQVSIRMFTRQFPDQSGQLWSKSDQCQVVYFEICELASTIRE